MNFSEDTILPFEDTSGAAAAEQQKVPFEGTSDADEAAHQKFDKEAPDASSRISKELSNKRKCIENERGTRSKHNSVFEFTTPPKMNKLTINQISPGCYVYFEEDLRPRMHSYSETGYVTECIGKNELRNFTVTYDKCSSSGGWVESNITYRRLTDLECPILSLSYPVREHISPSKFIENKLPPPRAKPPVVPLLLYAIISMGNSKGRDKCWKAKYHWFT